jgi:hypothetical protein
VFFLFGVIWLVLLAAALGIAFEVVKGRLRHH